MKRDLGAGLISGTPEHFMLGGSSEICHNYLPVIDSRSNP